MIGRLSLPAAAMGRIALPPILLGLLVSSLHAAPAAADRHAGAGEAPISLALPIDCDPGRDCWIANYVDAAPGPEVRDYTCGRRTYNTHKGIDFAIRDLSVMARGVPVLAAAPGRVVGGRDGVPDISFRRADPKNIAKRECGNGLRISHGNGIFTQYCHMRQGSVRAKRGERVRAGQVLGLVGLSGKTEFPHLHFQVQVDGKVIDPFVGPAKGKSCRVGKSPLWNKATLGKLNYQASILYNAGFANVMPKPGAVRQGLFQHSELSRLSPSLILWVDIFGVKKGDTLTFSIFAPQGEKIWTTGLVMKRRAARVFRAAGMKIKSKLFPTGAYRGEIVLSRQGAKGPERFKVERRVDIR